MLRADGFESALLGRATRCGQPDILAYDFYKCVKILIERDGMTGTEAIEYLEFNVLGAYAGEGTPIFVYVGDYVEADY